MFLRPGGLEVQSADRRQPHEGRALHAVAGAVRRHGPRHPTRVCARRQRVSQSAADGGRRPIQLARPAVAPAA